MNSYFVLVVVAVAIIGCVQAEEHDYKEELKKLAQECVKETGVDFAVITNIEEGRADDTADLKCYPKCILAKSKLINENDEVNLDGVRAAHAKKNDSEKRNPILNECLAKKGANSCETSDLIFRCYWAGITKAGLKD